MVNNEMAFGTMKAPPTPVSARSAISATMLREKPEPNENIDHHRQAATSTFL